MTAAVLLFLAATFFSSLPVLKEMQPRRFLISASLFLLIPAACGLLELVGLLRQLSPPGRVAAFVLGLMLLPGLTSYLLELSQRGPLKSLTEDQRTVLDLVRNTPASGRVLCDDEYLGNLIPPLTGREAIGGGLSNHSVLRSNFTSASKLHTFGRPTAELTAERMSGYLGLYNVRCTALTDPHLIGLLRRLPQTTNAVGISPVYLLDDPVPFIRIDNSSGLSEVQIRPGGS